MDYLAVHGKSYDNPLEFESRLTNWRVKDKLIKDYNENPEHTHTLSHNKFSDWNEQEITEKLLNRPRKFSMWTGVPLLNSDDLPESKDWREAGAVNDPIDQGACRAAHAFSATTSIEGNHFIKYGQLLKLSEQECVDCDEDSYGCNGGYAENCLWYASGNVGLMNSTDYPWTGKQAKICMADYNLKATAVKTVKTVIPKSAS